MTKKTLSRINRSRRRIAAKFYTTQGVGERNQQIEIVVIIAAKSTMEQTAIPEAWRSPLGFSGYETLISEPFPLALANVLSLMMTAILHHAIAADEGLSLNRDNYDDVVREVIAHGLRVPLSPDAILEGIADGRIAESGDISKRGLSVFRKLFSAR